MDGTYGRASAMTVKERLQWVLYGLIAGLLIGLVLGWIFSGIIGTAVKMVIVAALLVPVFFAWRFWRSTQEDERAAAAAREAAVEAVDAIEARGKIVHEEVDVNVVDVRER
jgi:predicted lipid-binding transport protein (Tim44 family)